MLKVDTSQLFKEITYHQVKFGKTPDYIICNENTLELLRDQNSVDLENWKSHNMVAQIMGINIAECNALKLGEFDLK